MKKILLTLFLTTLVRFAIAQAYVPLPMENAYWRVNFWAVQSFPFCTCNIDFIYQTNGDTVIGGLTYTKITRIGQNSCSCGSSWSLLGVIRQDTINRKIYIILQDSLTEKILYDFAQNVGDTINSVLQPAPPSCPPSIINAVDSVLIDGIYHKRLNIQPNGCTSQTVYFIEGIGSSQGLLEPLVSFESGSDLVCASHNGQIIYPDSSFSCSNILSVNNSLKNPILQILINPNPIYNGSFKINFNKTIKDGTIQIYDLLSRQVEFIEINNVDKISIVNPEIANGIFLVKITADNNKILTYKVIAK